MRTHTAKTAEISTGLWKQCELAEQCVAPTVSPRSRDLPSGLGSAIIPPPQRICKGNIDTTTLSQAGESPRRCSRTAAVARAPAYGSCCCVGEHSDCTHNEPLPRRPRRPLTVSAVKQDLHALPQGVDVLHLLDEGVPLLYQNRGPSEGSAQGGGCFRSAPPAPAALLHEHRVPSKVPACLFSVAPTAVRPGLLTCSCVHFCISQRAMWVLTHFSPDYPTQAGKCLGKPHLLRKEGLTM